MDPKHLSLLRIHDACRGLSDDEVEGLALHPKVIHAEPESLIHAADQPADVIHNMRTGRLKMPGKTPSRDARTNRYIGAGDQS